MNRSESRHGWTVRGVLLGGGYLLAAAAPLAVGIMRPGVTGYKAALLEEMIYGQAHRPFVKRQLVPLLVRAGTALTPESLDTRLRGAFAGSSLVQRLGWPPVYAPEFVLTLLVMYGSMIGFLVALRKLLLACLEMSSGLAHGVVLGVALGLPVCYAGQVYIYDYTQLFLFTTALLCMLKHRWWLFYPVFILACLNKETSVLLPVILVCWKGRRTFGPTNLAHVAVQGFVGLVICVTLAWVFRNNPGANTYSFLHRNLDMPFSVLAWIRLTVLTLGIILALWRIRAAPAFLSRGLLGTLPALLLATLFFGYIDELRDYYEALPFGVGLVLLTVGWRFGVRARKGPNGEMGIGETAAMCFRSTGVDPGGLSNVERRAPGNRSGEHRRWTPADE